MAREVGRGTVLPPFRPRSHPAGDRRCAGTASSQDTEIPITSLVADLRYAVRTLRRSPGFTLVAVLTLGIGIGATTTIFSVLNAVVLRPLPYPEPDRLVWLWETTPDGADFSTSEPNYLDFRDQARSFEHLAAAVDREVTLLGDGDAERLSAAEVTPNFFAALGVGPALGRAFLPEDAAAGSPMVVLSHRLWRSRFEADPRVAGRSMELTRGSYTVVGVMPAGFAAPGDPELWLPLAPSPDAERDDSHLYMIGRLAPGATPRGAAVEMRSIASRLGAAYPESRGGWSVRLLPLRDRLVGPDLTRTMWVLMGAVGLLLLLMCANLASLLLARGASRRRELGVRVALGAGRGRIVRQLLTESLLLAAAGMAAGLLLAVWGVPLVRVLLPPETPRLHEIRVDGAVLGFALAASVLVGLLFGLFPALQGSAADIRTALREGSRATSAAGRRIREALVVGELALAMTLLMAAGLLAGSFLRLQQVETGFAEEGVLAIPLSLPGPQFEPHGEMARFLAAAEERIGGLPGVTAVGATNVAPLSGGGTAVDLSVEGRPSGPGETSFARWRSVTPGFFRAAGVRVLRGRALEPTDYRPDAPAAVVVTEAFADRVFPGEDPLGRRVAMGVNGTNWRTVVGVVEDVRDIRLAESPQPLFFLPETGGWPWMTLLVRSAADPAALAGAVRREIRALDPTIAVPTVEPLSAGRRRAVAGPRFNVLLMGGFAAVAMILAVLGIYGIMSHAVAQRTREIGIRIALGARPGRVLRMVLGRGARLIAAGVGLGAVAALGFARLLGALLFDTPPADAATFAGTALLLGAAALVSAWIPARRAARSDPAAAFRQE
jgi:putative ABC transport system permease protein